MEGKKNIFANLEPAPVDAVGKIMLGFRSDLNPNKVDMGVGAYRTNNAKPLFFKAVHEAEKRIYEDPTENKEYLPIEGLSSFNRLARELLLGTDCPAVIENRVVTIQSLAGAGGIALFAEFCKTHLNPPAVYASDPTWINHSFLFGRVNIPYKSYAYWDKANHSLNYEGMISDLDSAPPGSIVIFQPSSHNPTGIDPTPEQWDSLADYLSTKDVLILFDIAYHGFASGDLEEEVSPIRKFVNRGLHVCISQTFSKSFGLYSERIGALHIVCSDSSTAENVLSQLKILIRSLYSSPPKFGALIISKILGDPELRKIWADELKEAGQRIKDIRVKLVKEFTRIGVKGD